MPGTSAYVVKAIISFLIAVLLAYLLITLTREEAQGQRVPVTSPIYDARLIELEREAVEEAYKKHVHLLFDNWVKDPKNQPARALTGIDNGRRAFIDSMTGIDARAQRRGDLPRTPSTEGMPPGTPRAIGR